MKDTALAYRAMQTYLSTLKSPLLEINLAFISHFTNDLKSPAFKFIYENFDKIKNTVNGYKYIDRAKILIQDVTRTVVLKSEKQNLKNIEDETIKKYGSLGRLAIWEDIALYYFFKKEVDEWFIYKKNLYKSFPESAGNFIMNNDAWFLFENSSKPEQLSEAIKWSKLVIESEPTANYFDTYANLLYKSGLKEQAILTQEKALTLPAGNNSIENVKMSLEKMRAGLPTWPEKKE